MIDEEILKLVKEHFEEEWCEEDGHGWVEFAGKLDAFAKFARAMFREGYHQGVNDGQGHD